MNKISDFLQGARNCPVKIIPSKCAWCTLIDMRPSDTRKDIGLKLKPRCPEPNFDNMVLIEKFTHGGFHHENMNNLYWTKMFAPPFHCVCGRSYFRIEFQKPDKFHYPLAVLKCRCGRKKKIIFLDGNVYLNGHWLNKKRIGAPDKIVLNKNIVCVCGKISFQFCFERRGFSYFPIEGPTAVLACKCRRFKKIRVDDIDASEPWVLKNTADKNKKITVRIKLSQCPDIILPDGKEKIYLATLEDFGLTTY